MKQIIKNIFNPGNYGDRSSLVLLLLRVAIGGFMLTHGLGKLSMLFSGEPIGFPDPLGIGAKASLSLTVFAEVFCSLFLIFGLATRLSAIPLLITMLVAIFIVHGADDFGKKELPLLYSVVYFSILIAGAGKYSVDNFISKKIYG